jgi:hypothetical protein
MIVPNFTITLTAVKYNVITNSIIQIDWTILAELNGFNLNEQHTTNITDGSLGVAADLTETNAVAWLEANDTTLPDIKYSLQLLLNPLVNTNDSITVTSTNLMI